MKNLECVLSRLEEVAPFEVEYLGHKSLSKGLQPTDEKVKAIKNAPAPRDISKLNSFLRLSTIMASSYIIYLIFLLLSIDSYKKKLDGLGDVTNKMPSKKQNYIAHV